MRTRAPRAALRLAIAAALCSTSALAMPAEKPRGAGGVDYAYLKSGKRVPLLAEDSAATPIARVGDDVVQLGELVEVLASAHESRTLGTDRQKDVSTLLGRLIDVHLLARDARAMGIEELPEFKASLKGAEQMAVRLAVQRHATRGVRVKPADVERAYRQRMREWKVTTALFAQEADARRAVEQVRGVGSLEAIIRKAVADGAAKGSDQPEFLSEQRMLPPVVAAVKKLRPGSIAEPIAVEGGYAVVRLDGTRVPEDPAVRREVAEGLASSARALALQKYTAGLVARYARPRKKLLEQLDFDAEKPGLDAMAKDQRVVVVVEGDKPVTVADMVEEMRRRLYHGAGETAERKRLNRRKGDVLNGILQTRLLWLEARRLKVQETAAFKNMVDRQRHLILFDLYMKKAIAPALQVTEEEARAHYQAHPADYTLAEFLRLESLGFATSAQAQRASDKLRAGADFKFMAQNADGLLPADAQTVRFEGRTYSATEFSPGLASALAGSASGDYRIYQEAGRAYVIHVLERLPAQVRPFEDVAEDIRKILAEQKLGHAIQQTAAKLRQSHPVEVLFDRIGN